jgi:hypothetical protein
MHMPAIGRPLIMTTPAATQYTGNTEGCICSLERRFVVLSLGGVLLPAAVPILITNSIEQEPPFDSICSHRTTTAATANTA